MPKLTKPKGREESKSGADNVKVLRAPVLHYRCYCGTRYRKGKSCRMDHDAMAVELGKYLLDAEPLLRMGHDKDSEVYKGPPWTLAKLKKFKRLYSNPVHSNILDKKVDCPFCRQTTTWGQLEFSGCLSKGCVGATPE